MKIGIDARTLSGRFTGDRTYWRGLISGLAKIDAVNEYVIYSRLPIDGPPPETGPNFVWRQLPNPASDALWLNFGWPAALKKDKIDVAHSQYNLPIFASPCPFVTTVHDVTFALFPDLFLPRDRFILNTFIPPSLKKAAKIVAVSECTRRDILRKYKERGVTAEKVVTVLEAADARFAPPENGQESARKTANERLKLTDKSYALAVGVLQPRKNLRTLLDAFALVKLGKNPPPHRLIVVGKRGWKNEELDAYLATIPEAVKQEIHFAGYVEDVELPTLYGGADAFCYPSLYEGFGLPPLEAMACACPVLVSKTSSLPEVVGDAGILLDPNNSEAWANALQKVLTSPTIQARWRERGPAQASKFSWERAARETLSIYESCKK